MTEVGPIEIAVPRDRDGTYLGDTPSKITVGESLERSECVGKVPVAAVERLQDGHWAVPSHADVDPEVAGESDGIGRRGQVESIDRSREVVEMHDEFEYSRRDELIEAPGERELVPRQTDDAIWRFLAHSDYKSFPTGDRPLKEVPQTTSFLRGSDFTYRFVRTVVCVYRDHREDLGGGDWSAGWNGFIKALFEQQDAAVQKVADHRPDRHHWQA